MNLPLPRVLLWLGLGLGALVAGLQLGRDAASSALPPGVVARVGERLILRDEWLKAVAATASERRTPLTAAQQQQILDRLIDEELLVQHGLALGLVQRDQRLRGQLVSEVLFTAGADRSDPDETELQAYFATHRDRFAPPGALRIAAWQIDTAGQRQPYLPPLPDRLLPPAKLQQYLGPGPVRVALDLPLQVVSEPLDVGGRRIVLTVLERAPGPAPEFAAVREAVLTDYRRHADEAAVRELLQQLRQGGRVQKADLP